MARLTSDIQWGFLKDVAKLIQFAQEQGYKLTVGECFRTISQQLLYFYGYDVHRNKETNQLELVKSKKRSWTTRSKHLNRLAIDLNVFKPIFDEKGNIVKHVLTYSKRDIQVLGDYWESLNPKNEWGGNWKTRDTVHFQRNL